MDPEHCPTLRDANITRQNEWCFGTPLTLTYRGNELAGEVGEACNIIKKLERENLGIRGSRATIAELARELADVVICTDLIAMDVGIDLNKAIQDTFNAKSEELRLYTRLDGGDLFTSNSAELIAAKERIRLLEAHVEQLQDKCNAVCACSYDNPDDVCLAHSPKLKTAEERIRQLEKALQPFANLKSIFGRDGFDPQQADGEGLNVTWAIDGGRCDLTLGQFRRARKALEDSQ